MAGDPVELVRRLRHRPGAGVWLAGALLGEIDELVIKRYPVVLGTGIPFSTTDQACKVSFEIVDDRILRGGTTVARFTGRRDHRLRATATSVPAAVHRECGGATMQNQEPASARTARTGSRKPPTG